MKPWYLCVKGWRVCEWGGSVLLLLLCLAVLLLLICVHSEQSRPGSRDLLAVEHRVFEEPLAEYPRSRKDVLSYRLSRRDEP